MSQQPPWDLQKPWPPKDILNSLPPAFQSLGTPRVSPAGEPLLPLQTDTNSLLGASVEQNTPCCPLLSKHFPHRGSWNGFTHVFLWARGPQLSLGDKRAKHDPMPIRTQAQMPRARNLAILSTRRSAVRHVCVEARETRPRRSPRKPGQGPPQEDGHYQLSRNPSLSSQRQLPARQEQDAFHLGFPYLPCRPRLCLGQLNLHLASHSLRLL